MSVMNGWPAGLMTAAPLLVGLLFVSAAASHDGGEEEGECAADGACTGSSAGLFSAGSWLHSSVVCSDCGCFQLQFHDEISFVQPPGGSAISTWLTPL